MTALTAVTQAEAWLSQPISKLKGQRKAIIGALRQHKACTRADLHKHTGISITSLCARLTPLINEGWVRTPFDTLDTATGKRVAVYALAPDVTWVIDNQEYDAVFATTEGEQYVQR